MNWQKVFSVRGLNYWYLGSAFGWNLIGSVALLILSFQVLQWQSIGIIVMQILILVGSFLISGIGGYIIGRLAGDGRGPAYGVYGSLSGVILFVYVLLPSGGVFGILVAVSSLLGGFNGGLFGLRVSKSG